MVPMGSMANVNVSSGKLEVIENFASKQVAPRDIYVWLPRQYDGKRKFAVLYMHDGQMLFDARTTWNKQAWDVDDVAAKLMDEKKIRNTIVVGIPNAGDMRHSEYFPQRALNYLTKPQAEALYSAERAPGTAFFAGPVVSDNYLRFLVEELKPHIDDNYSVLTDRANTFVMGSSMGGLISLYAIGEYPQVFGGAGCVSTHWPGAGAVPDNPVPQAFYRYVREQLPPPGTNSVNILNIDWKKDMTLGSASCKIEPQHYPLLELNDMAHYEVSREPKLAGDLTLIPQDNALTVLAGSIALANNATNSCRGQSCLVHWQVVAEQSDGSFRQVFFENRLRNRKIQRDARERYCLPNNTVRTWVLAKDSDDRHYRHEIK